MLQNDRRNFENRQDMFSTCRKCGCNLVLLPDDRRQGFCFECFDPTGIDEANILTMNSFRVPCESA
jgi:hypothetical protein